ncbi:MAG: hypothetical protein PHH84_01010 [Oscillospiraceae bacterium]|nr:hypothetical protein [Oscillospiraceae bacterium]MDD4413517.1 hypothetical protein [Oscillospiraceae bacterium]
MNTDLLELNRAVIQRKANGKTIWQPRIGCWYDDRVFRGEQLPGDFKGFDKKGIYEKIGCSDRLYNFNHCFEIKYDSSVKAYRNKIDELTCEYIYETPVGKINQIIKGNTSNPGQMPVKWWIENRHDLKVYSYIEEAATYSFNMNTYNKIYAEYAHLGLPTMFLPRVNMQKMFIDLSGVENAIYLLSDDKDYVEGYFKALSIGQEKMLRVVADSPIEWINYGDNIHCKLLPPEIYKKYVLPEYEKRGDILHASGKFTFSHWDGDVKDLLQYAKTSFLDGIEAITPVPQGDVTLEEVKEALGDEVFLIDGIASILFNNTYPLNMLREQTKKVLNLFEGQLVLGISDEFPSDGLLERIEYVNEMVNDFNSKRD